MPTNDAPEAGFTEFQELEDIRISIPKKGHPAKSPFRGEVTHVARVSRACAEELEAKLERVNADVRHGVPRIYRGDRELAPPRGEDVDDVEGIPVAADATAPERREVESHREHVRMLKDQVASLQRQADGLHRDLEHLRTRREGDVRQLQLLTENTARHAMRVVQAGDEHVEASLRRTFSIDSLAQEERAKTLAQFAQGAANVRAAREVLDSMMLRDSWGELFRGASDLVSRALDSDLGKMAAFQVQAIVAAKVGRWLDLPDLTPQDALAAMMVTGAKFQASAEAVSKWAALHASTPEGQAAAVVVSILRGDVGVEALEELAAGRGR